MSHVELGLDTEIWLAVYLLSLSSPLKIYCKLCPTKLKFPAMYFHVCSVIMLSIAPSWQAGVQVFEPHDAGVYSGSENILVCFSDSPGRPSDIDLRCMFEDFSDS